MATIAVAKLLKISSQTCLSICLDGRSKQAVAKLVGALGSLLSIPAGGIHRPPDIPRPWLSWQIMHKKDQALVYDLRHDPRRF